MGRWEGAAACACPESRADAHKMLQHLCAAEAQLLVAAKAARLGLQVKVRQPGVVCGVLRFFC